MGWTGLANVLLAAIAALSILYGIRQRALLLRVHQGLKLLLQNQRPPKLKRSSEDRELILDTFDALAHQLSYRTRPIESQSVEADRTGSVLMGVCAALHPTLKSIREQLDELLAKLKDSAVPEDTERAEVLSARIEHLVRVIESSNNLGEFRRGISELRRELGNGAAPRVILLDAVPETVNELTEFFGRIGWRVMSQWSRHSDSSFRGQPVVLILLNATQDAGVNWSVLPLLLAKDWTRQAKVWLYHREGGRFRVWRPTAIWIWSDDDWLSDRIRELVGTLRSECKLVGDTALGERLIPLLQGQGIVATQTKSANGQAFPVGLRIVPTDSQRSLRIDFDILILPESAPLAESRRLAEGFAAANWIPGQTMDELSRQIRNLEADLAST